MDIMNRATVIAAATTDAYSFRHYGLTTWTACAAFLLERGLNAAEVTTVLYSKLMRIAADDRADADGLATLADFTRLMDEPCTARYLEENLDEYVLNTLGEDYVAAAELAAVPQPLRLVWSRPNV